MTSNAHQQFLSKQFPEVAAGGFTSIDGTIEFYNRVNALVDSKKTVLDFGAGRAAWFEDDKCDYRRNLRLLVGKAKTVIACDVDPAVLKNRACDKAMVCTVGEPLPLPERSVDVIVADYVFEHLPEPDWFQAEVRRVLKPGGWLCARTPGRYSYVALAAGLLSNRYHVSALRAIQPSRKAVDIFPTRYLLNTVSAIRKTFPKTQFADCTYYFSAEPAYHFERRSILLLLRIITRVLPKCLHANLFVFIRRRT